MMMTILFIYLLAAALLIQFPLAAASPSPTQSPNSDRSRQDFNKTDPGTGLTHIVPGGRKSSVKGVLLKDDDDEFYDQMLNPGTGLTHIVPKGRKSSGKAVILDDDDDEFYDQILDPSVQSVYFKAMRRILKLRDRLCSICLATVSTQEALPYEHFSVTKFLLEREYSFVRSVNDFLIQQSEMDEEISIDEDSPPENFKIEVCNRLVPEEVKRLTAKRLIGAKGYLRRSMNQGKDTSVEDARVKAYERLKHSLDITPGDLECNANYDAEVEYLTFMLRTHRRFQKWE